MPWRISGSWSTSTVSNETPRWSRIATARLEKPHCGKSAVPFINRTTSLERTISSMRVVASVIAASSIREGGGELEGVERAAHAAAQRLVDALVLADPRQPADALRHHPRGIVIAVAGKVGDLDAGIGDALADQRLDLGRRHRHRISLALPSAGGAPRRSCARGSGGCATRRIRRRPR